MLVLHVVMLYVKIVMFLTETWLCNGDNSVLNELLPPGYDIRHVDRGRRGGGIVLIYKKYISFRNIVTSNEITQFELSDCMNGNIVIVGDFNIDWLNTNESESKQFCNILEILGFVQNICTETHRSHNLLDYIITRKDCNIISDFHVSDSQTIHKHCQACNTQNKQTH